MPKDNKATVQAAKDAIDEVFNNSDVPAEKTAEDLREIRDHIGECFDCLRADGVEC